MYKEIPLRPICQCLLCRFLTMFPSVLKSTIAKIIRYFVNVHFKPKLAFELLLSMCFGKERTDEFENGSFQLMVIVIHGKIKTLSDTK